MRDVLVKYDDSKKKYNKKWKMLENFEFCIKMEIIV